MYARYCHVYIIYICTMPSIMDYMHCKYILYTLFSMGLVLGAH